METVTDNRPKFVHYLGKSLLEQKAKRGFLKGSYIELGDLIHIQSVMFEFCGFVAIRCDDNPEALFRVLSTREGLETEGVAIAEQVFDAQVGSFIYDALDPLDLVFRTVSSRMGVSLDFGEFLSQFGSQPIKTEELGMNIPAWGIHGGIAGVQHTVKTEELLRWKYSTWQERGLSQDMVKIIEDKLGTSPISFQDAENVAVDVFGEFCKSYYPTEAASFWFI